MSHQLKQDALLALLYGETSPEEAAALRLAIADDEELAAQWRQLQESHQLIGEQIPPLIEPPEDVQENILAAARQALPDKPYRPEDSGRRSSFWSSPRRNNALAAVLLTLITALGAYLFFAKQDTPHQQDTWELAQEQTPPEPMAMAVLEVDEEEEPEAELELEAQELEPAAEITSDQKVPPQQLVDALAKLDEVPPKTKPRRAPAPAARPMSAQPAPRSAKPRPQMRTSARAASPRVEAQSSFGATLDSEEPRSARRAERADGEAEDDKKEEREGEDLLDKVSKAIDRGDFIAAKNYLRKAHAESDLPEKERERAEKLQQTLNAIEDQMRVRPTSLQ